MFMYQKIKCAKLYLCVFCSIIILLLLNFVPIKTRAAYLTNRSITTTSPLPGANSNNTFNFTFQSSIVVGSVAFEYCSNSPLFDEVCDVPAGLDLSTVNLVSQSGITGFSLFSSTANKVIIGRIPGAVVPPVASEYVFSGVINPSQDRKTFYIRISTYSSGDGTGVREDIGAVAFSTSSGLGIGGYVPPYLSFCVGVSVSPNCSVATGNYLSFGELSSVATKNLSSQFGIATNDPAGYITYLSGLTMTSGNNSITANNFPTLNNTGSSQFGLNLRANTDPQVGADKTGVGSGTVSSDFNNINQFVFKNASIATSVLPSDFNVFTVSYIANINEEQPAGIYTTTLTYIATVQF